MPAGERAKITSVFIIKDVYKCLLSQLSTIIHDPKGWSKYCAKQKRFVRKYLIYDLKTTFSGPVFLPGVVPHKEGYPVPSSIE